MLLTEARATSYQRSSLPFSDRELLRGAALYQAHCASCHGAGADGRGVRAASLPRWPSVLGPALFDNRLEGELHWRVAHGGDAPQDAPAMPAFGAALSDDDIWRVLDYLRLQAYGLSGGASMPAVPAPHVALSCRDGRAAWLTDLRGLPVRVLAQAPGASPEPQDPRLLTVALSRDGAPVADADCVATGPQAWAAYALATGLPEDGLAGAQFMVDRRGWPRAPAAGRGAGLDQRRQRLRPRQRMENSSAQGLGELLGAMDRKPIPIPDIRRAPQGAGLPDARHAHRS
ncbi:cytochrome c [Achromobacter xylosoxidans]